MRRLLKKTDESGQAMIEFALILPVLVAVLGGIMTVGFLMLRYQQLAIAARAAARTVAIAHDAQGVSTGMQQVAGAGEYTSAVPPGIDRHGIQVSGVNWGRVGGRGHVRSLGPYTAIFEAQHTISVEDDAHQHRESLGAGVGVVLYGVSLGDRMHGLLGFAQLAHMRVPTLAATAVMPAVAAPYGAGVPGVLSMNQWITHIVDEDDQQ
ncbi:MAG TPA: TadE family protein [Oscillatoriaceae cyanobacterium]